jgi:hypothetical protein
MDPRRALLIAPLASALIPVRPQATIVGAAPELRPTYLGATQPAASSVRAVPPGPAEPLG